MKNLLKYLVLILMFVVGGALGGVVMTSLFLGGGYDFMSFLLLLMGIIVVFCMCVIVHEGGHLIFGLLSGYRFSSFRIGSLILIRQNGRLRFRFLKLAGTEGQCLMTPPEEKKKGSSVLYNLGGVIMNLLLAIIFCIVYVFLPYTHIITQLVLIAAIISFIFALLNGIPFDLGIPNDGLNTLYLLKNTLAEKALNNQLLIASANVEGRTLSEMPDEWFTLGEDCESNDPLCSAISVFSCNRLLEQGKIEETKEGIESLLASNARLAEIHRGLLIADLIFCTLLKDGNKARIAHLYNDAEKQFMKSMKTNPSVLRTEYAIMLIRDKDENAAENIRQKFEKVSKIYPYQQEINSERRLMNMAYERYSSEQ